VNLELAGKRALVTASSRGIGRAAAERLHIEGCNVVMTSRTEADLAAVRDAVDGGDRIHPIPADLTSPESVEQLLDVVLERLGGIDIIVSNTGGPPTTPVLDATPEDWQEAFETVLFPVVRIVRRIAPGMRERRWGRIVFVTSTWVKQPHPGGVLSAAARSAVSALAKQLAIELGPDGVLVNHVMPGPTWTDRSRRIVASMAAASGKDEAAIEDEVTASIPIRRYGKPEEIGDVIAFLASSRASFLTGTAVAVDGGQVRSQL
jgi:3-oxoacyl-[acyl-carrier protein] reductase